MVHKCVFVIIIANFPVYFFHFVFLSDILHDLKRKKINIGLVIFLTTTVNFNHFMLDCKSMGFVIYAYEQSFQSLKKTKKKTSLPKFCFLILFLHNLLSI